jgi:hypothetical protein
MDIVSDAARFVPPTWTESPDSLKSVGDSSDVVPETSIVPPGVSFDDFWRLSSLERHETKNIRAKENNFRVAIVRLLPFARTELFMCVKTGCTTEKSPLENSSAGLRAS